MSKELSRNNHLKIRYRITTNGFLLDKDIADFCKRNNILLDISLDGPEREHNKFRIHENGEKTWSKVIKNVIYIKKNYPDFYKKNVSFQSTIHPLHNETNIVNFFKKKNSLFDLEKVMFNRINLQGLKPVIRDQWLKNITKNKYKNEFLLKRKIKVSIEEKFRLRNLYILNKLTPTCFPGGERVFIDSKGNFHICEKMNPNFSIGNINQGFNLNKIREIIKKYNQEIIRLRCWECDLWSLCTICYAYATEGDKIKIDCETAREQLKILLSHDIKNKEKIGEGNSNVGSNALINYIEQL